MKEVEMLELLETYIDLTGKQDEVIHQLGYIVKRQATELAHLRNLLHAETSLEQFEKAAGMAIKEYEDSKPEP